MTTGCQCNLHRQTNASWNLNFLQFMALAFSYTITGTLTTLQLQGCKYKLTFSTLQLSSKRLKHRSSWLLPNLEGQAKCHLFSGVLNHSRNKSASTSLTFESLTTITKQPAGIEKATRRNRQIPEITTVQKSEREKKISSSIITKE